MSLVKTQELNKLQQSKGKYTMYIQGVHVHVYQSDLGQVQYIKYLCTCTSTHSHGTVKYKYTFSKLCLSTCTMFFCIIQTQFQVQIPPVLYIMFSPEN